MPSLEAEVARQRAAKCAAIAIALRDDAPDADDPYVLLQRALLYDRLADQYLTFADALDSQ